MKHIIQLFNSNSTSPIIQLPHMSCTLPCRETSRTLRYLNPPVVNLRTQSACRSKPRYVCTAERRTYSTYSQWYQMPASAHWMTDVLLVRQHLRSYASDSSGQRKESLNLSLQSPVVRLSDVCLQIYAYPRGGKWRRGDLYSSLCGSRITANVVGWSRHVSWTTLNSWHSDRWWYIRYLPF